MKKNDKQETNNSGNELLEKIKELYNIMCESNVIELSTKIEKYSIKIKRFSQKNNEVYNQPPVIFNPPHYTKVTEEDKTRQQQEITNAEEIISPINGIFYRSPSPGAAPFVNEGDIVSAGDVLCIIEAMKIMNEIKAEKKCKILKVLCENGSSVAVGTKLFLIEPL